MDLETSASIKDGNEIKEELIDINREQLEPTHECCIYIVPKNIRRINEQVYTPELVSIGPFHHGKEELADMEKHKARYILILRDRITIEKWEEILTFTKNNEQRIRNFYAETSKLESLEFVMMILYDAVFIVELFLRYFEGGRTDFLLHITTVRYALSVDLQLLENQLPYFVLEELYNLAFARCPSTSFMDLSYNFFCDSMLNSKPDHLTVVKHFTDLRRTALLKSFSSKGYSYGRISDVPCAVKLRESGIKFKLIKGEGLLDIRFEKRKWLMIPFLKVPELQMPRFKVCDETECLLRNMMVLEQCHYPSDTKVCNYLRLMDYLINNEKDVDLLVGEKIISNCLGDNAAVANMINKLGPQIHLSESCYYDICEELKAHYNKPWNHTKAKLRRVYFSNLWRGTATVAAIIVLLLSIIQTVCTIIQVL